LINRNGKTVLGATYRRPQIPATATLMFLPLEKEYFLIEAKTILATVKKKSCGKSCSPSDYREGGKCEAMGCYKKTPLPGPGITSAFHS